MQGGWCLPELPQLPLHNTPTSVMHQDAQHERHNAFGNEDQLFHLCQISWKMAILFLFFWSQLQHSCATLFKKMLRLIYSHQKLQHFFTWTFLEWMRFWHYRPIFCLSPGLMDSSQNHRPGWDNKQQTWRKSKHLLT